MGIGEKGHPYLQQDLGSLKYGVGEAAEPIPISLPKNSMTRGVTLFYFINIFCSQKKYKFKRLQEKPGVNFRKPSFWLEP